ncbi:MAG: PCMD domain-containing protein [Bacteroidales bacterium]|nr:PCMD domain-containing protein [Bacteroidales bacterium]
MKKSILRITLLLALPLMVLSSCIKDELPNTDADILDIELDKDVIIGKKIENDRITVFITPNSYGDLTNIKPTYVLSEGSKIIRGDDNYDYSSAHEIEVISEDGNWRKVHEVRIMDMAFPTEYYFENWEENRNTSGVYEDCYERLMNNGNTSDFYIWASGNLGYRITGKGTNPSDYPTYKTLSQDDAHNGAYAAVLETRYVGAIGQGSPLAAGNLFIGEFSGKGINIMKQQMKATRFGIPFNKKPKSLKVWFKYKSGGIISIYNESGDIIGTRTTNNDNSGNNQNTGSKDYAAIYAVMFDNVKAKELYNGKNYLDGSTILSSPAEVGRAILTDNTKYGTPTNKEGYPNEYVEIELPFTFSSPIDENRLKNFEYSITIVFSSSYYGAEFQGAVGSKLWIDDVILECE